MNFRIYTIFTPYKGPPTPAAVREWGAFCVDPLPIPVYSTWLGPDLRFEAHPAVWGRTREEAIENLKQAIRARFIEAREKHGCTIEQEEIDVPLP
jgi:hypothetical protein